MVCLLVYLTKHSGWSMFSLVWCVQTNKSTTLASSHAVSKILYLLQESSVVLVFGAQIRWKEGGI